MAREFKAGDILIFQIESGFGLLRVLAIDEASDEDDVVWHLAAYDDLYLDPEMADAALTDAASLRVNVPHLALTNRAFESTQTARMTNLPVTNTEAARVQSWRDSANASVTDISIRLLLGLR